MYRIWVNGIVTYYATLPPGSSVFDGTDTDEIQIGRSNGNLVGKFACATFFDTALSSTDEVRNVMDLCQMEEWCK